MILAKLALGLAGTIAVAGAYTFHEGVMTVQEEGRDGRHVHVWVPAAVVPLAVRVIPARYLERHAREAAEWFPLLHTLSKELRHYPETDFVEIQDSRQHVHIRTHNGKLLIDVTGDDENVHLSCPLSMIEDVAAALERDRGAA